MGEILTTSTEGRAETTMSGMGGIYCGMCGEKTYLSKDGSHRRCPNCDDGMMKPKSEICW